MIVSLDLNISDILQLLAESFGVDTENVELVEIVAKEEKDQASVRVVPSNHIGSDERVRIRVLLHDDLSELRGSHQKQVDTTINL